MDPLSSTATEYEEWEVSSTSICEVMTPLHGLSTGSPPLFLSRKQIQDRDLLLLAGY